MVTLDPAGASRSADGLPDHEPVLGLVGRLLVDGPHLEAGRLQILCCARLVLAGHVRDGCRCGSADSGVALPLLALRRRWTP